MKSEQHVPFVDLIAPHREMEDELLTVCRTVFHSAGFIGGPMVEGFESEFAQFCESKHCIGVASGTDAVRFALIAAGVQPGDVVLTVPNTFIATTEAISQAGAIPEFVDVEEESGHIDVRKLQQHLEGQCRRDGSANRLISIRSGRPVTAVVPVHLYGQVADMDGILELAQEHGLVVVEDACQAHGAEYYSMVEQRWRKAGSFGAAGAFSFYPGKNLGACGEGGAVTTNDDRIAQRIRMLRDHGQTRKYYHSLEGYNGRLDALQAGILRAKLAKLPEWNRQRREAAARYDQMLAGYDGIRRPAVSPRALAVYHLYVIRTADRDALRDYLSRAGVDTGIHYPVPLHMQQAYAGLGHQPGDFPVCEMLSREILSLPMFPTLNAEQQRRVAAAVESFVSITV